MTAEWDDELLAKGAEVFVLIPGDKNGGQPRHAKIQVIDPDAHPRTPYRVELDYGVSFGDIVNASVGGRLDELGMLWATTSDQAVANVSCCCSAGWRQVYAEIVIVSGVGTALGGWGGVEL